MSAILEIEDLHKNYGENQALAGLSLSLEAGDIYGLIGPNGAGKTTTFRIVATLLRPNRGLVRIAGMDLADPAHTTAIRRCLGYMPDSFGLYEDMTVAEYLTFFGAAYDIAEPERSRLVGDVLELTDLTARRDALVDELSRGMQQRLGLARVLIHDPDLLILDEPASGLDPRARVDVRTLLLELQKMGKSILISSHILADIGEICNRVGIIEHGRKVIDGTIAEILAMVPRSPAVLVRVAERTDAAQHSLEALPGVRSTHREGDTIVVECAADFHEVWRLAEHLVRAGFRLTYIEPREKSLEHAFLELTTHGA